MDEHAFPPTGFVVARLFVTKVYGVSDIVEILLVLDCGNLHVLKFQLFVC